MRGQSLNSAYKLASFYDLMSLPMIRSVGSDFQNHGSHMGCLALEGDRVQESIELELVS